MKGKMDQDIENTGGQITPEIVGKRIRQSLYMNFVRKKDGKKRVDFNDIPEDDKAKDGNQNEFNGLQNQPGNFLLELMKKNTDKNNPIEREESSSDNG